MLEQPQRRTINWPIIGLTLIVLAFGLAGAGIALALQQAEALNTRLQVHAKVRAGQIARTAADLFRHQLDSALRGVAERQRLAPDRPWITPPDWPEWIDALYINESGVLRLLMTASGKHSSAEQTVQIRSIVADQTPISDEGDFPRASIVYGAEDENHQAIAVLPPLATDLSPITIVAVIDPQKLRAELLDPLMVMDDGLHLVPTEKVTEPWSQPIAGALRVWSIQPSAIIAREQRNLVMGQTVAYLGLTTVALGTMLAAMWLLVRVARREVSLAEMKASFVADVSHELKTPLALIRMFGETLLSNRVTSEEKRQEYYAIIVRESTRLTNLINNILDFSRIEAGRKDYVLEPIDVGAVVKETYDAYRDELVTRGFEHHLTLRAGVPPIPADRDAVAQAVLNLISNAIKYSDDDRYVSLEVRPDTRRDVHGALISVEDRGIGIKPEHRAHLFQGFYRVPDGRVRERPGTGLGLSVVKHIVDAHHGTIEVESRLVKGTAFRIFLPGEKSQPPAKASPIAET